MNSFHLTENKMVLAKHKLVSLKNSLMGEYIGWFGVSKLKL
jgi:hypothetical protein